MDNNELLQQKPGAGTVVGSIFFVAALLGIILISLTV